SARRIIFIYLIYIFIGTLLLTFSKMSFFDAINHAIAAISTGGFSTRVGSIYEYNNIFVEGVIMVLMLLGGTNFLVHYYMMTGHIKKVYKHIELYYVLGIIFILVPIMALVISNSLGLSYFSGIRVGLFEFISAATTTGFTASAGYQVFPSIFIFIMILLMVIGGGIGSTAGGIKQFRVIVLFKSIYWYFKESISSNRLMFQKKIYKVDHEEEISSKQLNNTFVFVFIYILFLIVGTSLFMILDNSLMDSLFETASALGTVGLSVGLFTYESPLFVLWFGSFLMLLGRLEILIVLITITNFIHKIFSRK
ncbi:MAG: TrkH family potassium uptake protein, partial [Candidatus Izimaplasma sp.]|nr:TrkH family potassium uptake protein [Candidatus Izimaplasma bacterium]